ncbi:MAG TPA: hypothetical protein VII47_13695 [Actinomycetota bacterium]
MAYAGRVDCGKSSPPEHLVRFSQKDVYSEFHPKASEPAEGLCLEKDCRRLIIDVGRTKHVGFGIVSVTSRAKSLLNGLHGIKHALDLSFEIN